MKADKCSCSGRQLADCPFEQSTNDLALTLVNGCCVHGLNRLIHSEPLNELVGARLHLEVGGVVHRTKGRAGLGTRPRFTIVLAPEGTVRIDGVWTPH